MTDIENEDDSDSIYSRNSEDTLIENNQYEFKIIDLKINNWNSFGGREIRHQFDEDDIWDFKLTKNEDFKHLGIELNPFKKTYIYQKEYKLIFTVYDLNEIDNCEVTDGYTFYSDDFTKYYEIPNSIISPVIENNSFGLKIEFTYEIINSFSFIKRIKHLINDKYRYKEEDILEEKYFEFTINSNIREIETKNKKLTKIKSEEFSVGGYEWYIQLKRNNNNEYTVSLVCADNFYEYIITNFVFIIRNKGNNEIIKSQPTTKFVEFTKNSSSYDIKNFIEKSDIDLLKNNFPIGIYLRIYTSSFSSDKERDICIDSFEEKIIDNNKEYEIYREGYHEWKINNWSKNINIDNNNEDNITIISLNNSDFLIKDKQWHFTLKNIENDSIIINLNYNKENYEDIYANYILGLCKYDDYQSVETIQPKELNEFKCFTRDEDMHGFQFNKKEIEKLVDDYDRINIIVYIRMYRKKNKEGKGEPKFRINEQKIKRISTEYETLKLKDNDFVVIDEHENMDINPEFSFGYKIGRSHRMGLIPKSLYDNNNNK